MNLFPELPLPIMKTFYDYAVNDDRAGALKHIQQLNIDQLQKEVLEAGFSMIGKHHGKPKVLKHVIEQIGN